MKKMKKIVSIVVGILFLMNNLSFADVFNLAAESRLAPLATPELLDIMKLTAGIIQEAAGKDLATYGRDITLEIDKIGETGAPEIRKESDILVYGLRNKAVLKGKKSEAIFFQCSIVNRTPGGEIEANWYLCCARKIAEKKYDFEFFTTQDIDKEISFLNAGRVIKAITKALGDTNLLVKLAKQKRTKEEKEGIARFVEQQNETDPKIADAIKTNKAKTLGGYLDGAPDLIRPIDYRNWVVITWIFMMTYNQDLAKDFLSLVKSGQLMSIPKLEKPHSGGVGIYFPTDVKYWTAEKLLHEICEKAGMTDEESGIMEKIYSKYIENQPIYKESRLAKWKLEILLSGKEQEKVFEKFKKARFAHRWNKPLEVDYYSEDLQAYLDTTIIDAAAGEVIKYISENKTVIFIPQDFATKARCKELAQEFPGAEFKPFNQHTGLDNLPGRLQWYRNRGYKIGIVGMGLDFDKIKNIVRRNQDLFKDVLPINVGAEGISNLVGERRKSFQKGVLTITLLARSLPKEGYKETHSYMTLKSLLGMVLPGKFDLDTYIENLVNTEIIPIERFSYVINAMLNPIVPMDYKRLEHIIEVFISA